MPLSEFTANEWKHLTPARRVVQCRRMAEEARELALAGPEEMRRAYEQLAQTWDQLADQIEKIITANN